MRNYFEICSSWDLEDKGKRGEERKKGDEKDGNEGQENE